MTLSADELARYSRHLALREIGVAGQEKLKAAKVLVIGAGGLGSPSILYLAAAGIGTLGIVDFDRVDISNLQRQVLFDTHDIGIAKVDAAAERLRALNPHMSVVAHRIELQASNVLELFKQYDVVLDGTDRFATRYLTNDACVILGKPLVSAAIHRFEGQAFTYAPKKGPCYRCLFPEPPAAADAPNCSEAGVPGVLPGIVGLLQATEALKLILALGEPLVGRLLSFDALGMHFRETRLRRDPECPSCGPQATFEGYEDIVRWCSAAG
jgi:sulfur-carrier protein adenylyltransferase/sulfurtransferase